MVTPAHERMRIRESVQASRQLDDQVFLGRGASCAQAHHALGQRKDIPDTMVHLFGQRLLNFDALHAEPSEAVSFWI
jgi:hypothetical protein